MLTRSFFYDDVFRRYSRYKSEGHWYRQLIINHTVQPKERKKVIGKTAIAMTTRRDV